LDLDYLSNVAVIYQPVAFARGWLWICRMLWLLRWLIDNRTSENAKIIFANRHPSRDFDRAPS
jgi:hypothetical protein